MNYKKYNILSKKLHFLLIKEIKLQYHKLIHDISYSQSEHLKMLKLVTLHYHISIKTMNLKQLRNVLEIFEEKYGDISKEYHLVFDQIKKILMDPLRTIRQHQLYLLYDEKIVKHIQNITGKLDGEHLPEILPTIKIV
jgi:hypothetical protein